MMAASFGARVVPALPRVYKNVALREAAPGEFANAMPALLWRWGHIASGSHYLLIGTLALTSFP